MVAHARQISPDEAAAIASEFLNSSARQLSPAKHIGVNRVKAKSDATVNPSAVPYYVFNGDDNHGFVVVSGDDRAKKILGYSDSGSFDFENIPPALEWLLEQYEKEIADILPPVVSIATESNTSDHKTPIPPLLTTKWGQWAPYNNNCPREEGNPTPSGCVATAMAQIMNYHQWPDKGEGTYSYDLLNGQTISCDFESVSFQWDKCIDSYDDNSDKLSSDAVAELMYACGISFNTTYSNINASGSHIAYAKRGLVENFKYDSSARIIWKNNYYQEEWNNLIYHQIEIMQPVFVTGGNHAFVCDGYSADNFFHFNWGWDGEMDGYFQFSSLSPYVDSEFHTDLTALIDIKKREGETKPLTQDILCKGEFIYMNHPYGEMFELSDCHNFSPYPFSGKFGVEIEELKSGEKTFFEGSDMNIEGTELFGGYILITGRGQSMFSSSINDLKDGEYNVFPAYTFENSVHQIHCIAGGQNHICLKVTGNGENYIYTNPGPESKYNLQVSKLEIVDENLTPVDKLYAYEEPVRVLLKIKNTSDIPATNMKMIICDENDIENFEYQMNGVIIIEPNSEMEFVLPFFGGGINLKPGKYHLVLKDNCNNVIYNSTKYFEAIKRDYDMEVLSLEYEGDDGFFGNFKLSIRNNSDESSAPNLHINFNKNSGEEIKNIIQFWGQEAKSITTGYIYAEKGFLQGNIEINIYDSYENRLNNEPFVFLFPTYVNSITFICNGIDLQLGKTGALDPIILPENADNKKLNWTSSDENIATVDEYGIVTAVGIGEAIITAFATDGSGVSASCKVTVLPVRAESISLDPQSWAGLEGDSFTIVATVLPENTTDKSVGWYSSNTDIATVDADGNVSVLKDGQCTIIARTLDGSDLLAECIITSEAGINTIFADADAEFDIYDIQGILIKKSCRRDDIKQLSAGAYILCHGNTIKKLIIR